MKTRFYWQRLTKSFGLAVLMCGLFAAAAYAQPAQKFTAKFDKVRKVFKTPTLDLRGGKLVVSGEVRGIDVSGGGDGCYTVTVSTYRIAPNGEKILVRTRSKQICVDITRLPELVERIPNGRYLVEVLIDRPRDFGEGKFAAEINVAVSPEAVRP